MYRTTTITTKHCKRKKTVPLSSWMGPKILIIFGIKEFFTKFGSFYQQIRANY